MIFRIADNHLMQLRSDGFPKAASAPPETGGCASDILKLNFRAQPFRGRVEFRFIITGHTHLSFSTPQTEVLSLQESSVPLVECMMHVTFTTAGNIGSCLENRAKHVVYHAVGHDVPHLGRFQVRADDDVSAHHLVLGHEISQPGYDLHTKLCILDYANIGEQVMGSMAQCSRSNQDCRADSSLLSLPSEKPGQIVSRLSKFECRFEGNSGITCRGLPSPKSICSTYRPSAFGCSLISAICPTLQASASCKPAPN